MSSVSDFMDAVNQAERAYEFMIAYAGQGIGREVPTQDVKEIRNRLTDLREALDDALAAARRIPTEFDVEGEAHFTSVLDAMEDECDEATEVLDLLIAQDRITSQQVDNLNGMSVFQSVIMKLFFLEELTAHLDR